MKIEDMRTKLETYLDINCNDWPDSMIIARYDIEVLIHEPNIAPRWKSYLTYLASLIQYGNSDWQDKVSAVKRHAKTNAEFDGPILWDDDDTDKEFDVEAVIKWVDENFDDNEDL
jgi:hypothetical protein